MTDLVLYDATCGICTAFRDFAQERDRRGRLDFQPLGSEAHRTRVSAALQAEAPDTAIVVTEDGAELIRGAAVRRILARLGGPWRFMAGMLGLVPDRWTDRVYREVAKRRHRLTGAPAPST